jgi:hypothetical protein
MKKIPTIFLRDWNDPKHPITIAENPACGWVFRGEGVATRKLDGTACLIKDGKLYKRRTIKVEDAAQAEFPAPAGSIFLGAEDGNLIGWVPVGDGPEDQYHREAFKRFLPDLIPNAPHPRDGTYELVGPHIQGNPEHLDCDQLIRHGEGLAGPLEVVLPKNFLTFTGIRSYFTLPENHHIEGIVWHHPDGRMAKIKGRDFGLRRPSVLLPSKAATGTDPSR